MSERPSVWRPYLPEPQPACVDEGDPEPVPLEVLRDARTLCADFRIPPRQFRRRTPRGCVGYYRPESDIVAVNPDSAAMDGMGGADGYYAMLLHELLHATGHPKRLDRASVGDYSAPGYEAEERDPDYALEGRMWQPQRRLELPRPEQETSRPMRPAVELVASAIQSGVDEGESIAAQAQRVVNELERAD
jgi:Zincin-like metallopeptidase